MPAASTIAIATAAVPTRPLMSSPPPPKFSGWRAHPAISQVAYPPSDGLCNGGGAAMAPSAGPGGRQVRSDRKSSPGKQSTGRKSHRKPDAVPIHAYGIVGAASGIASPDVV